VDERRRNSDELLDAVKRQDRTRGRLRIFIGMCPGVGKTFSMLKAASEPLARGERVLVGVVETHGRKETQALLDGFTVLAKVPLEHKGTTLLEMDLDGILREKPALVLVDELAHTNAPGSRHAKRFQDVEELLNAGIDVFTTVNIQHVESRNDQIAQITGVRVRETVPDSIIAMAQQIELVDLSPPELIRRLREGKVYLGERAEAALQNFFKEEHLTALRELALRFTAEKVDQDLHAQMTMKGIAGPWNTNERLLVAVSHSPYATRLVRTARRMAFNLEAPWVALYVDTGQLLQKEDEKNLQENLALARSLGAEVVTTRGVDLAASIQRVCAEKNVTQIIMGRPDRRFFRDLISRGTLLDQLVLTTSGIDVHVIRAERKSRYTGFHFRLPKISSSWQAYYNTSWFLTAVSFLCYGLLPEVGYRALGSLFLLSILVVASFGGRGPIFFAAAISALVWNFFFIPPVLTFHISSYEDLTMVASFFVAAFVGGFLTSRIRKQEAILDNRERRTRLLYELSMSLGDAGNTKDIRATLSSVVDRQFGGACNVLFANAEGVLDWADAPSLLPKEQAVAQWAFENGKPAGWSTQTLAGSGTLCLPMRGRKGVVGVLSFVPMKSQKDFSVEKENFLDAVLSQAAIAFERLRFSEAAAAAELYQASEKLHQTLLNSVSHELRTPITAVIGSASALKDEKTSADPAARLALTDELVRAGQRLDRVVENLLDISRLESGSLQPKKEWFYVSELCAEVRLSLKEELKDRDLKVRCPEELLVEGDFGLLLHALENVLLNALKYSSEAVELEALVKGELVLITVADRGSGIPENERRLIFEKFRRLPGSPAGGLGLGLNIVRSIFELHGGEVRNEAREGGGTVFLLTLPKPDLPLELEELR
jgi:two-component system sensor histidine kinase KdpD